MKRNIFSAVLIFFLAAAVSSSQWDCRSILGGHFKPLYEDSPLSWAFEATFARGNFSGRDAVNFLFVPGLDLRLDDGAHELYFEPAYKMWNIFDHDVLNPKHDNTNKKRFGYREAFYKYAPDGAELTAGLRSTVLGDFFLLDERVLGLTAAVNSSAYRLNFTAGTVERSFARMGDFCGTRRTFYAVRGTQAGANLFEANIAGAVFKWFSGKAAAGEKDDETVVSEDEFFEAFAGEVNSSPGEVNSSPGEVNSSPDEDVFAADEFEVFEDFDNSDDGGVIPFAV